MISMIAHSILSMRAGVLIEVQRAASRPSCLAADEACRPDVRARRSTAHRAAPDRHRSGTPACLAPRSASSTAANQRAVMQSPHIVPVSPSKQWARLVQVCPRRAGTREAWYPRASGRVAGAARAMRVASRRFGSAMAVPAGQDGEPCRRRHSSRCPSAGRSLLSSALPTRVAAALVLCRLPIRIQSFRFA